ncbi:CLUMA_CG009839, isoform A [Clunio marinus]|uniref:CLUMA_CG009839, isoform A n=1 Tax=Clunio marinus TaxID=568069 RepID=A0A1J1I7Y2_9DIPT|nr:CLUMA_CG009839, isoform A [Clunio marinus]
MTCTGLESSTLSTFCTKDAQVNFTTSPTRMENTMRHTKNVPYQQEQETNEHHIFSCAKGEIGNLSDGKLESNQQQNRDYIQRIKE